MAVTIKPNYSRTVSVMSDVFEDNDYKFQRYLSEFQIIKFTYMFESFFDCANGDGLLQKADITALLNRMTAYGSLEKNPKKQHRLTDVMYAFYECLTDQVRMEKGASATSKGFETWAEALSPYKVKTDDITLNQWLNMWGRLCRGSAGISGFPMWVQLLGHMFFDVIDKDQDGVLSFEEFKDYYKNLVGVSQADLDKVANEGYRVLTANNGYKLDKENYLFCFANFLLGRDIYGPGKYIFGVFDNREISEKYKVKYNAE